MPQEKKIQDLVKFYQFISLSLIDYHRVNNPKYTFHPSREGLHLSTSGIRYPSLKAYRKGKGVE